ncbi:hypothetical protein OR16_04767 [Cupriavidus basilensis OR16]|uniref:Uncharacterized protein n=1 Tax=Cupriavidus basilensis OR16 TaxID=1127483 RepID=H1S045_9BURK|nr:hypothetical protein OR16_04767 [Cupriavidus basilensis OR16]
MPALLLAIVMARVIDCYCEIVAPDVAEKAGRAQARRTHHQVQLAGAGPEEGLELAIQRGGI